ncbi:TraB/GumN family protein [Caulobacter sp. KR2-114]|uniref:TraB/GumN family protein n=1 Tax=Caulobacter sp. KR2-114 TaxID=3400912 RepID=UPI003BFD94C9
MKRCVRLGLAGLLVATLCLAAGAAAARPPVWVVRGKHATIVLFGSVHVLPAGLDWPPPALTDALAKADELWFEIPITPAAQEQAAALTQSQGPFPPNDSLANHLTPAQSARLRRVAERLSLSTLALDRMKPWLAEVTISLAMDARFGASASDGVETRVQALAPVTARRRAFETVPQQIGFLAGAPMDTQIASLDETLGEIEDRPDTYDKVIGDWMAGDAAAIRADALDPLLQAAPVLYQRLIVERDRRWTRTIRQRLKGRGVVVMVVGVGHLVGPDSVPAMLRAQGVAVDGP